MITPTTTHIGTRPSAATRSIGSSDDVAAGWTISASLLHNAKPGQRGRERDGAQILCPRFPMMFLVNDSDQVRRLWSLGLEAVRYRNRRDRRHLAIVLGRVDVALVVWGGTPADQEIGQSVVDFYSVRSVTLDATAFNACPDRRAILSLIAATPGRRSPHVPVYTPQRDKRQAIIATPSLASTPATSHPWRGGP